MKLSADTLRLAVPVLSLLLLLAGVFCLQPRAMSYNGLNLLFNLAVPIALATIAQMIIMAVNDLDLSMGTFVSFVACVTATFLHDTPLLGVADPAGVHRGLCGAGRGDPPAQPAVHRGDAGHELCLGGAGRADPARAGRRGAGLGARR